MRRSGWDAVPSLWVSVIARVLGPFALLWGVLILASGGVWWAGLSLALIGFWIVRDEWLTLRYIRRHRPLLAAVAEFRRTVRSLRCSPTWYVSDEWAFVRYRIRKCGYRFDVLYRFGRGALAEADEMSGPDGVGTLLWDCFASPPLNRSVVMGGVGTTVLRFTEDGVDAVPPPQQIPPPLEMMSSTFWRTVLDALVCDTAQLQQVRAQLAEARPVLPPEARR